MVVIDSHFIAPEYHPDDDFFVSQTNIYSIALDTEITTGQFDFVAAVKR